MPIYLGENIRRLRTAKGITQEQFGYEMGVSAQAVSRWENSATYPDITMLPMIADFFDVTLDELMGRGRQLDTAEREAFIQCMYEKRRRGEIADLLEGCDKMLQKYPNDAYLLYGKANVLYDFRFKQNRDMSTAKEIVSLCNKINCCDNLGMRCGATALLVRIYAQTGQLEEARRLANGLPSFEVGREMLILECLQDAQKKEHYQYLIQRFEEKIAQYKKRIGS